MRVLVLLMLILSRVASPESRELVCIIIMHGRESHTLLVAMFSSSYVQLEYLYRCSLLAGEQSDT